MNEVSLHISKIHTSINTLFTSISVLIYRIADLIKISKDFVYAVQTLYERRYRVSGNTYKE